MGRIYGRASWGARPPKQAYRYNRHQGNAVIHYTADRQMDVADLDEKPAKPGPKWYKIWRTPHRNAAEKLRRINISRKIRAYNRAMRKWNLSNDADMARIEHKERSMMRSYQSYHQNVLEWNDIGYHVVIFPSGNAYLGRPCNSNTCANGAHARNANHQIGISHQMTAGELPTKAQVETYKELRKRWGVKYARGHRQVPGNSTQCPGKLVDVYNLPRSY